MNQVALGELEGNDVMVRSQEQASQIYNKGYFGEPQSRGALLLNLIEAIYLMESERLEVIRKDRNVLLREMIALANKEEPNFEIRYLVYRDLRQRGYVVKPNIEPLDFRVFPRGGGPNSAATKYWVLAISERAIFDLGILSNYTEDVFRLKKSLLLAVVDEESDLTYYAIRRIEPKGRFESARPEILAHALFLKDRVLILDENETQELYGKFFYGKMVGKRLQLSLLETAFLLKNGIIEVTNADTDKKIGLRTFMAMASRIQPDFSLRLAVYEDLKEKRLIVKTGFKYGSHFRGYEEDPDRQHAKYLVHALPHNYRTMWPEVSRTVRLAHGVKKDILFGRVEKGKVIEYVRLQRVKP